MQSTYKASAFLLDMEYNRWNNLALQPLELHAYPRVPIG